MTVLVLGAVLALSGCIWCTAGAAAATIATIAVGMMYLD